MVIERKTLEKYVQQGIDSSRSSVNFRVENKEIL